MVETWRGLSRPWKTFVAVFLIAFVLFALEGMLWSDPFFALFSALLWGAAAGSLMRLRDRIKEMSDR